MTDEGDSWAAHRGTLNPTFARRHLNGMVDLMLDPIERVTADIVAGPEFDMHAAMVEATLRVVANALFSQDFGPLVGSMNDLATRGLRRTEKFGRLGLWGLMPRPVYEALMWCTFSGVPLPPPFRESQQITLALDEAVNDVLDDRLAHPTESTDLLNVLFGADNGTWPRKRVRDEALTFMLAGHETTANAMSWFWYLMARNPDARQRMLAEVDEVLEGRRPTASDLTRLPWTTACIQESQRCYSAVWMIGTRGGRGRRHRRSPHPYRNDGADPDPPHPPRRTLVARPRRLRPDTLPGRCRQAPAALSISGFRRRASDLHRAELRADGDGLDGGDDEPTLHIRPRSGFSGGIGSDADAEAQEWSPRHRPETGDLMTGPDYETVIVGAGFSGIGAAIKLDKAGLGDYVVIEVGDGPGGTWYWNTYPGIAVDIPSFSYQFSFEKSPDWTRTYAPGSELKAYAEHCVEKYGLRSKIRFNSKVLGGGVRR